MEEEFNKAESGNQGISYATGGDVKVGKYCMIKGHPCKVVDYSTSKAGKHGSAKAHIVGIDIFTNKKVEDSVGTGAQVEIPDVKRTELELIDIDDEGFCTFMLEGGDTRSDIKLPDDEAELVAKIKQDFNDGKTVLCTVVEALNKEKIIQHRTTEN